MSLNDVVTALLAAAAVAVPIVALMISNHADQRATRSTLSDLTVKINKATAEYQSLGDVDKYAPMREIEMLVRQAEYLTERLTTRILKRTQFPKPLVATTLAQALEAVSDYWWADTHWREATSASGQDPYSRARAFGYWAAALCYRGQAERGKELVDRALSALVSDTADACIVKGEIYMSMAPWDKAVAGDWLDKARNEYGSIPQADERYRVYVPGGNPILMLSGAELSYANLRKTKLKDTDSENLNLVGADMSSAGLHSANLTGADLRSADLSGADLRSANLTAVDLRTANLTGAKLTGADLTGADLTDADLTRADLTDTDLTVATHGAANFSGALFSPGAVAPAGWLRDPVSGLLARAGQ